MENIILTLDNGKKKEFVKGIKLKEVINLLKEEYTNDIISAKYNSNIINYEDTINKSGTLSLYDINTKQGFKIYERGLLYLFEVSALKVLGKDTKIIVKYSLDKGIFCKIDKNINTTDITNIKKIMKDKVKASLPFTKIETTRNEAIEYFKSIKREDKVRNLFYNISEFVTLYKLEDTYNYIIGDLPNNTSVLKYFDLSLIEGKGIVVRFPSIYDNSKVLKYTHHDNYYNSLEEYTEWGNKLNINNLGELNDYISNSNSGNLIQLSEIMQDYKLLNIAEEIVLNKDDYKVILLSGPSS